ncbi:MAG TPA: hypothetical protein P5531_02115 [Bacteroidales bacterium]|nr:hypothetical protein [Bacteroidales bacterium]HSA43089.1 hypothetical protein [Bacteroidales bacterium]
MNNRVLQNIFRLIILVAVQILILNRVQFMGFINPYLYVMFILLLPFELAKWQLLLYAFGTGLIIDIFANTYGLHAGACTLMAYARPAVLKLLTSRKEYEPGLKPGIRDLGFNWFFSYASILILVHHAFLFFMEAFRFSEFFSTLLRVFLNGLVTLLLVFIAQYLFFKKEARI